MTIAISSILELPNIHAIYEIYGIKKRRKKVFAIFPSTHLKESIFNRLFDRDFEFNLEVSDGYINPLEVSGIRWWEIDKIFKSHVRWAAKLIADEVLIKKKAKFN